MTTRENRRERILLRLKALLDAQAAANDAPFFAWRNRAELGDGSEETPVELPAYVLLDGVESKLLGASDASGRRGPQVMLMEVQIFYVRMPAENALNEGVGEDLSDHLARLQARIIRDGTLADLCGASGFVEYRGMKTDMQTGAEVRGQLLTEFVLAYTLDFNKL
jgi:hypothetical protein